jgi:hypothetical protein
MAKKKDHTALAWGIGLGTLVIAGIGIYFYEKSQPPAPTTLPPAGGGGGVGSTAPAAPVLAPGQNVYNFSTAELAQLNKANPSWATQGIPLATWNGYLSGFQVGLWNAGFRPAPT